MILAILALAAFAPGTVIGGSPDDLKSALALFNAGKYQQCFVVVTSFINAHPESGAAYKVLGMDEFMLGNAEQARTHLERATQLSPTDADAFYYLGRLHFTANNAVAARAAYQKAIELNPSSVRNYNNLGQPLEALGLWKEAEGAYRKAIALDEVQPKHSEWPYYNLGLLCLRNGRADDSVAYFEKALTINPAFVDAKVKKAMALSGQDRASEAQRLLEDALRTDPTNAEAHYHLALLLLKSGRPDEAKQHFALFSKYRKP